MLKVSDPQSFNAAPGFSLNAIQIRIQIQTFSGLKTENNLLSKNENI